jgi:hypothetical protein
VAHADHVAEEVAIAHVVVVELVAKQVQLQQQAVVAVVDNFIFFIIFLLVPF